MPRRRLTRRVFDVRPIAPSLAHAAADFDLRRPQSLAYVRNQCSPTMLHDSAQAIIYSAVSRLYPPLLVYIDFSVDVALGRITDFSPRS